MKIEDSEAMFLHYLKEQLGYESPASLFPVTDALHRTTKGMQREDIFKFQRLIAARLIIGYENED